MICLLSSCNAALQVHMQQSSDLAIAIERAAQVENEPIEEIKILFSSSTWVDERPAILERAFAELAHKNLAEHILVLDVSTNDLTDVPSLQIFTSLQKLDLSYNHLLHVPADIPGLAHLQELDLTSNYLEEFTTWPLASMQILALGSNKLTDLQYLGNFSNLIELYLSDNKLHAVPDLSNLIHLQVLDLADNGLLTTAPDLTHFQSLKRLDLNHNNFTTPLMVPQSLKRHLKIEGNVPIEYEKGSRKREYSEMFR